MIDKREEENNRDNTKIVFYADNSKPTIGTGFDMYEDLSHILLYLFDLFAKL